MTTILDVLFVYNPDLERAFRDVLGMRLEQIKFIKTNTVDTSRFKWIENTLKLLTGHNRVSVSSMVKSINMEELELFKMAVRDIYDLADRVAEFIRDKYPTDGSEKVRRLK